MDHAGKASWPIRFWPVLVIAGGVVLIIGSALFGILLVGTPGPDDSFAELARKDQQVNIAFGIFITGMVTFVLGAIAALVRFLKKQARS